MSKAGQLVYEDLIARGKGDGTAREWRSLVEKFVEACGEKGMYGRSDVIKFLALMRGQYGHCDNTIIKDLRVIKLLCDIQGWEGGFPQVALKRVRPDDIRRTVFSKDDLKMVIVKAKELVCERQQCYLALATIYGMRREELSSLDEAEVQRGEKITVDTLKGGTKTVHSVPDEIKKYLRVYEKTKVNYMTEVFEKIVRKVGIKLVGDRWGWHSIRRALATELLVSEVSGLNILRFMRWSEGSIKGEFGMLTLYAKKDQEKVDAQVFKVHPFLEFWR